MDLVKAATVMGFEQDSLVDDGRIPQCETGVVCYYHKMLIRPC